jgi:pilin isopeptide linkage protein
MNLMKLKKCAVSLGMVFLLITGVFPFQAFATELATQDSNSANVAFEVILEIGGDTPKNDASFTFVLDADENAPVPDSYYANREGAGVAKFDKITFTSPGKYHYSITQKNNGVANYTYDNSVYSVNVNVSYNQNSQLVATYSVSNEKVIGSKVDEMLFVNKYTAPVSTTASLDDVATLEEDIAVETTSSIENKSSTENTSSTETTTSIGTTSFSETTSSEETTVIGKITQTTEPSITTTEITTNSSNTVTTANKSSPRTGDETNNIPWIVLLCVVLIGMIGCFVYLKFAKNHNKKQDKS